MQEIQQITTAENLQSSNADDFIELSFEEEGDMEKLLEDFKDNSNNVGQDVQIDPPTPPGENSNITANATITPGAPIAPGPNTELFDLGELITASFCVGILDRIYPRFFLGLVNNFSKEKIKPKEIRLDKEERRQLEKSAEKMLGSISIKVEPWKAFIIQYHILLYTKFEEAKEERREIRAEASPGDNIDKLIKEAAETKINAGEEKKRPGRKPLPRDEKGNKLEKGKYQKKK